MEKAAEVLVPPQPDKAPPLLDPQRPEGEAAEAAAACASSFDPMEEFRRRFEDIVRTHGPGASRPDRQVWSCDGQAFTGTREGPRVKTVSCCSVTERDGGRDGEDEGGGEW